MYLNEAFEKYSEKTLICRKSGSTVWEIGLLNEAIDFANSIAFSLLRKFLSPISKKDLAADDWGIVN